MDFRTTINPSFVRRLLHLFLLFLLALVYSPIPGDERISPKLKRSNSTILDRMPHPPFTLMTFTYKFIYIFRATFIKLPKFPFLFFSALLHTSCCSIIKDSCTRNAETIFLLLNVFGYCYSQSITISPSLPVA